MLPEKTTQRPYLLLCLEEEVYCPVSYIRLIAHLEKHTDSYCGCVLYLPRDLSQAREKLPAASLLIMARNRTRESHEIATAARAQGIPILYDIDDYVWHYPDYSKVSRYNEIYTDKIIALADRLTTPSIVLKDKIHETHPDKEVTLIPNPGNIGGKLPRRAITAVMANSDFFRIPELRESFFQAIHDAARKADVTLILHYLSNDPPNHLTDSPHLRVIWTGFRSYSSYKQLLHQLQPDFGFVLLRDETFSRYKSVVKSAEFADAGAIGLYSAVEPYQSYISHGKNGFLVPNTYEGWLAHTTEALLLPPTDRSTMLQTIRGQAEHEFDFATINRTFIDTVAAMIRPQPQAVPTPADELPSAPEFTFREAYAYHCWQVADQAHTIQNLRTECEALRQELDSLKKPGSPPDSPLRRLLRKLMR